MSVYIRHSAFDTVRLRFPIDWTCDPYKNKNWVHHLNSLRWLQGLTNLDIIEKVLSDFHHFHCVRKRRNPYYNSLRGDHTASIRALVLLELQNRFQKSNLFEGSKICGDLLRAEVKNLQSEKMYRSGHNHGLMVDISLLTIFKRAPSLRPLVDVPGIVSRSQMTLDGMWHENGTTKEHSVSYQEYNLPITFDYFFLAESLNISLASHARKSVILEQSKRLLGFALRRNGEYFPIGDSFRAPNETILNKAFGKSGNGGKTATELLRPYSTENGVYYDGNFFIFRNTVSGNDIHFACTSCWNSPSHKQNDELSFCLEINGVLVFDDPGYTEFLPWDAMMNLKNERSHSTIVVHDVPWCSSANTNGRSKILSASSCSWGFRVHMTASRVEGLRFDRIIELRNTSIEIKDIITQEEHVDAVAEQSFVLNPDLGISRNGEAHFTITHSGKSVVQVAFCDHSDRAASVLADINYVKSDRRQVVQTQRLSRRIPLRRMTHTCASTSVKIL